MRKIPIQAHDTRKIPLLGIQYNGINQNKKTNNRHRHPVYK